MWSGAQHEGRKVGLLKVRLFRPFPAKQMVQALPPTVKRVVVLEKTKETGATGARAPSPAPVPMHRRNPSPCPPPPTPCADAFQPLCAGPDPIRMSRVGNGFWPRRLRVGRDYIRLQ